MSARNCFPILAASLCFCAGCGTHELVRLDADQLHYSAGAEDELRDGPNTFDIFPAGEIAVNDPLANRMVIFTADGVFHEAWNLGFAADRLRILDGQTAVVRRAAGGDVWTVRAGGRPVAAPAAWIEEPGVGLCPGTHRMELLSRQERLAGYFAAMAAATPSWCWNWQRDWRRSAFGV